MPLNSIAIIGASVRAAAMSAVRAGFSPVAADLFADEDLRAICSADRVSPYPAGLVDWLDGTSADAWIYTGALENHSDVVDTAQTNKRLLGNAASVLRRVRSPGLIRQTLSDKGLPFPDISEHHFDLPTDGTWLVKPFRGSGGIGIEEYRGQSSDPRCPRPQYFQRRIEGNPGSAVFVGQDGRAELLGITRQLVGTGWTNSKTFQYTGSVGPWVIGQHATQQIRSVGRSLAGRFGLVGLFGVDFVYDGEAVWTIEVNPRYTASVEIVERVSEFHALAVHVEACAGCRPRVAIRLSGGCHGKAILFARHDLIISEAFTSWATSKNNDSLQPAIADIPSPGIPIRRGQPVATVFATGQREDSVLEKLKVRLAEMEAVCQQLVVQPD